MLLFAGISLAIPWYPRWDYGPGLIGFGIILCFGYVGFGQFLPSMFLTNIVILAILYLSSILQTITWAQYGAGFWAVPGLIVAVWVLVYLTRPLARNFFFKRRAGQGLVTGD